MRLIPSIFVCLLLLPVRGATDRLTTTAELRALTEEEAREGRAFDLTALVIMKTTGQHGGKFIVRDKTGGLEVAIEHTEDFIMCQDGDIIRCRGTTMIDRDRQLYASCTNVTRVGQSGPPQTTLADPQNLHNGECEYAPVRVRGIITHAFVDEIDPQNKYLILQAGKQSVYAATQDPMCGRTDLARLIDAEAELTGICMPVQNGHRIFLGPRIQIPKFSDICILRAPPADPFDVPFIEDIHHVRPDNITHIRRRRVDGLVTATWRDKHLILLTDAGRNMRVELSEDRLPPCGTRIEVVGFPETDLFHLNLSRALWKPLAGSTATAQTNAPEPISAHALLFDSRGNRKYHPEHQGRLFRLTGIVRSLPPADDSAARMMLDCDGNLIPVDASSCADALSGLSPNSKVAVTGICVLDVQNWSPATVFPRIEGLSLVLRSPADIAVLSRPSWWTPARLLVVIGSLLAALVGFFVWNRILNRIVERRSRQLLREQVAHAGDKLKVGERTRLAVELHDSLSQTLTGVSFQIDAAEQARQKDPSQVKKYLDVARQTLMSCREELRNCLWDLRNNALEEEDAEVAVRRTVEPQIGDAELSVGFSVPRQKLTDNTFHAILRVVRELAVNGVRHGGAAHIAIRGRIDGDRLVISVADDGSGFDPENHPGADEGHFGLLGVAERVESLNGKMKIASGPGDGTLTEISFAL